MDLRFALTVFHRHRRSLLLLVIATTVLAVAAGYALPATYAAGARVTLQPNLSRFFSVRPTDASVLNSSFEPVKTTTETYSAIIKSRLVAERIVDELQLDRTRQLSLLTRIRREARHALGVTVSFLRYGEYRELKGRDAAIAAVQGSLDPRRFKEAYVLDIRARADSPETAARIANAAARLSAEVLNELAANEAKSRKESATNLEAASRKDLLAASVALDRFRKDNGSLALDAETSKMVNRLAEVDADLQRVSAALADQQLRLATVSGSTGNLQSAAARVQEETKILENLKSKLVATRSGLDAELNLLPEKRAELASLLARQSAASLIHNKAIAEQEQAVADEGRGDQSIQILEPAQAPLFPSGLPRGLLVAVAALVSFIIWTVAAFGLESARLALAA